MKNNMGTADRIIRVIIAAIVVYLFYTGVISGILGYALLILSSIFVLTSLVSFCPIYTLIGVRTCSVEDAKV